ncbi:MULTISPECIES: cation diffusion facilitator family transporter [unclassified Gordonia (in: high G+C Gram-positive bacteria)]|uniref:cation diffusion facilitator family transporter n=1 Tax=unclassified Gordonia (in: high G+C Gram-positive bacteria) TaxID=2657482 RepID=UPI00071CEB7F|nr:MULTISPECIES: cation diffusion facilitator family transporter [unclassified Gordonia (in: high G+C Gram-positive bacteria)]KSU57672.1 transporter [Gordonia sp. SGD-V-85]SCC33766.1 cation diffusion facilitator family transporter [Gordonia sp. v-85]
MTTTRTPRRDLSAFAVLSIVTAIVVIGLKLIAWRITGSVGLLSDALESTVNLVAAIGAFVALRVAAKPPDRSHNFGHTKAEYLSAVFEGVMIVVAAVVIVATAVDRLLHPEELDEVGMGLAISVGATVVNAVVGWVLIRAGRRHRSLTLEADGKHLMTDVWTTAGVVVGVFLVDATGWLPLDPLIAIAVAANILVVGGRLVWRSGAGLMDSALPDDLRAAIDAVLARHRADRIDFHDVRTREAGHERFVQLHMLVPGDWSVQRAHDLAETIEDELRATVDDLTVTLHVEPINDPRAYEDWRLD